MWRCKVGNPVRYVVLLCRLVSVDQTVKQTEPLGCSAAAAIANSRRTRQELAVRFPFLGKGYLGGLGFVSYIAHRMAPPRG